MAKLYYRYGAMGSGKSLDLLKTADNYDRKGRRCLILTPSVDTRHGVGVVKSRVGLESQAMPIHEETRIDYLISSKVDAVLVDESQFLTTEHVRQLTRLVDDFNIPVMAYGLKTDFKNELFEGSAALLAYADSIEEVKTICEYCERKATMNQRLVDGNPVDDGEQVQIGDEEYVGVCRPCYKEAINE
jgi:thymidine kinase